MSIEPNQRFQLAKKLDVSKNFFSPEWIPINESSVKITHPGDIALTPSFFSRFKEAEYYR